MAKIRETKHETDIARKELGSLICAFAGFRRRKGLADHVRTSVRTLFFIFLPNWFLPFEESSVPFRIKIIFPVQERARRQRRVQVEQQQIAAGAPAICSHMSWDGHGTTPWTLIHTQRTLNFWEAKACKVLYTCTTDARRSVSKQLLLLPRWT